MTANIMSFVTLNLLLLPIFRIGMHKLFYNSSYLVDKAGTPCPTVFAACSVLPRILISTKNQENTGGVGPWCLTSCDAVGGTVPNTSLLHVIMQGY